MKEFFLISMLVSFAAMCSCQKQDTTAEQQLAQRKVELDARENALAERESSLNARETALNERENALAEKEKAMAKARTIPHATPDSSQVKAETDSRIQQLPPDLRSLVESSQANSAKDEKDRKRQEGLAQGQRIREDLQSQRQRKFEAMQKWQNSGGAVSPAAEAASPTPSPAEEDASSSPSATPQ
jgi:hypothetical protein